MSAGIWIAEVVELEVWKIKKIAVGGGRGGGGEKRGWDGSVCQKKRFGEEHE